MADEKAAPTGPQLVKQIVGEIAAMEYAGDVQAIGAVLIDGDGDCRVMTAFTHGNKLGIIAGSLILQRQLMDQLSVVQKAPKI